MQKTVPTIAGTPQAFSYNGIKIVDWTIQCARGGIATLALTTDGWNEVTATSLTAPSYLTGASVPNLLNWSSGQLLTGGTASTVGGVTTISGNAVPIGLISSFSVKGTNVLAVDRFTLGSQSKAEQLTNGFSVITGEFELEFANLTDCYNAFAADTGTAAVISMTSPTTVNLSTPHNAGLTITLPSIKFDGETPNAAGPGCHQGQVPFTALDDMLGDPIVQLSYTSLDTTV